MCKNLVRVLDNSLLLRIRRERQEVLQPNVNEAAGVLLNWEKQAENFPETGPLQTVYLLVQAAGMFLVTMQTYGIS